MTTALAIQLRCRSKLQGIIKKYSDDKVLLEIRCKDKWCADRSAGVVVLHYFNVETGELDHTKKFRDPKRPVRRKVKKQ
ncbi:hypothetical protein HWB51_gp016 [Mycobacterium phage Cuke]|uniref:Uncharacterized protein n=1 Tax=Mycobacterium phage Cuke TaxID=2079417 RepID=A0A2L1IWS9_9CAUD|nr:hypothetical protein HWB51_gp016 [Mycobacterium phage Cuke]AVD99634.1 hypothetical protein SEA_CUKE_16 [Mycobacterium phage Cuke]